MKIAIYTPAPGEQRVNFHIEILATYIGSSETKTCPSTSSEFCESDSFICTDSNERVVNGILIDNRKFRNVVSKINPDYSGPICYSGYKTTNCTSFNQGRMECWFDPQGVEHCPEVDDNNGGDCFELESNPSCGFVSSECVSGASDSNGECFVFKDTYDCGYDVSVPTGNIDSEYSCSGPIKCMGDSCIDINKTTSSDFAKANALLNAAQFMTQDMSCEAPDGSDNGICKAFAGEGGTCKKAVGGAQDCCEKPAGISAADYITLIMQVPKLDGAVMGMENGSAIKGAYQIIRDPIANGWTEITQPFTSYIENVTGAVDQFTQPIEEFVTEAISSIKDEVTKMTGEVLGNASTTGTAGVPAGAPESMSEQILGQQGAAFLNSVMAAYTAYVVTMMVIQIVWACEEEEFELNSKRALEACTYLGSYCKTEVLGVCIEERESYCCYNSPLSMIIQEGVRPQLGMDYGDLSNPDCSGIPLDRIAEINWEKVDLDRWTAMLVESGQFPNPNSINLDSLTGNGSAFDIEGFGYNRENALERTQSRLEGIEVDKVRRNSTDTVVIDTGASN